MLFQYDPVTQSHRFFDSWEEMSKVIPLRYESGRLEEKNMTCFDSKGNIRLGAVYDLFGAIFMQPNTMFVMGADHGYMPGIYIDLRQINHHTYCDQLRQRGNCYISKVIVSEQTRTISGKFMYYKDGNKNDHLTHLWGTAMRIALIDEVLKDLG